MRISSSSRQMSPARKFLLSRIVPLILIMAGACIAFFGVRGLIRAKASVNWPSAEGKVVASSVERRHSTGNRHRSHTTYHAEILYEFTVNGSAFKGTRVSYGDFDSNNPSHARGLVNRYPIGKKVAVYYMPANPKECLLEPGLTMQAWFLPGFGLFFFTVGSLMALFLPRTLR